MRRSAIVLLLALGCASSGSHNPGITVYEATTVKPTGNFAAATLFGQHMLRVQVENRSHQEIVVHHIKLAPAGPDLFTDDPSQSVEQLIGPGDARSFALYLEVSTSGRSRASTSLMLDSVSMDLSCTGAETGVSSPAELTK